MLENKITSGLFEAYIKCPTKCFLKAHGDMSAKNVYADWMRTENESYRHRESERLANGIKPHEYIQGSTSATGLKTANYCLALDVVVQNGSLESEIHAIERKPSEGRGISAHFIPVRFIFRNKLRKDDKLLLAYDAVTLSGLLGCKVDTGKIYHGDNHSTLKVNTAKLRKWVGKLIEKITAMLSTDKPPDIVLNRHCVECEFQAPCRQKAIEKDDLSLLSGMTDKERNKLNSKGIFTFMQLSYTFRPRRRSKGLRDKKEKYHHSLKALAIREKKIHIVDNQELKIEGTPVYFDVEGLPDRDFYYLIGLRVGNGATALQYNLWADTVADKKRIWDEFLTILSRLDNPLLIHYGSYETTFLKRMCDYYGKPQDDVNVNYGINNTINILSTMYGQVYFPTYSNSLKEIATWLGFEWPNSSLTGATSIAHRCGWEVSRDPTMKQDLIAYNAADCGALELVTATILSLVRSDSQASEPSISGTDVVNIDSLKARQTMWPKFSSSIYGFEQINKAARWDYQRDRVYLRADERAKNSIRRRKANSPESKRVNKQVHYSASNVCPYCGHQGIAHHRTSRLLFDLHFSRWSLKRRVIRYDFCVYWCRACHVTFGTPNAFWPGGKKYGRNLVVYVLYNLIELCIPQRVIAQSVNRLFGYNLADRIVNRFKEKSAISYAETSQMILRRMLAGTVILADETQIVIKRKRTYVWVFTNLHEVVYIHSETREGDMMQKILADFKGVLVSDFYAPYDSVDCPQQKCLLHLTRDLNDESLAHPYDEELGTVVKAFAELLKPMVDTVDRHGLKKYFLKKHIVYVERFFMRLGKSDYTSEAARKCKVRFEKCRDKLFTFLAYDGVPWNNNNAEHAIKAFARLRRVIDGISTLKGIEQYLVLLSICQTCKYQGLDFLDFLLSGEKDIEVFAQSKHKKIRTAHLEMPHN